MSKKVLTFAAMDIEMTLHEAWLHFLNNLPQKISRLEKNQIRQAERDARRGKLGTRRIVKILNTYGEGRYRVEERVVVFVT